MSDTPRTDQQINGKPCTRFEILAGDSLRNASVPSEFARTLERELNAANAEIQSLKYNIDRVMGMYAAKDNQICNLLHICRANGIDVSSQDLINGKEAKL